ncbi:DUF2199 domain-containing protein, partial [Streptomyces sp. NPDC008079]
MISTPTLRKPGSPDQCVIKAQHYFVKGMIDIPVTDSDDVFSWG